jgi:LacI family transcriptional regulator
MSLAEIAKRANVSIATVSRTINGIPSVRPAVARRVQKVVEELGYYPNTHARALVSGQSRIFGLLVSEITNPFFPEIVQTFEDLGFQHNYEIIMSSTVKPSSRLDLAARRMLERRVEGVAILTFGREDSLIEIFRRRNVPAVVIDVDSPWALLKTIRIDYEHGIRQAVQHLAALGHVRIAFITGPIFLKTAIARKLAFQKCMTEIGLEVSPRLLVEGDHTMEAGMRGMAALAALAERPSAVICSNDVTAIGVMRHAFELGLGIPGDLSVVGFDDIHLAQYMTPPLTTVRMSRSEIASLAFEALLNLVKVQGSESSGDAYEIKTNLVLRGSTALAPGRKGRRQIWGP